MARREAIGGWEDFCTRTKELKPSPTSAALLPRHQGLHWSIADGIDHAKGVWVIKREEVRLVISRHKTSLRTHFMRFDLLPFSKHHRLSDIFKFFPHIYFSHPHCYSYVSAFAPCSSHPLPSGRGGETSEFIRRDFPLPLLHAHGFISRALNASRDGNRVQFTTSLATLSPANRP